jgi:hypothetical protein
MDPLALTLFQEAGRSLLPFTFHDEASDTEMVKAAPLVLELSQDEKEVMESLARTPWYALQTDEAFQQLDEQAIRTAALIVRADRLVRIASLDTQLRGRAEAFRLCFRIVDNDKAPPTLRSMVLSGGRASLLEHLHLVPRPKLSLLWQSLDYPVDDTKDPGLICVTFPDGLLLVGDNGRLLVRQDELPTWLRLEWDDIAIEKFMKRAYRVDAVT